MSDTPAIRFEGLVKSYGDVRALDGIDLDVPQGDVFGFLGPNGAGKTTAIRVLMDLIRPNTGRAEVLGFDAQRDSIEVRRRCGYLPGDLALYDSLGVDACLDLVAALRGGVDARYRDELIERLNLDRTRRVGDLSRGNYQKVGLMIALMAKPDVNDLAEQRRLAPRRVTVTFEEAPPAAPFERLPGVRLVSLEERDAVFETHDAMHALIEALAEHPVRTLETHEITLEELFLSYYEEPEGAPTSGGAARA